MSANPFTFLRHLAGFCLVAFVLLPAGASAEEGGDTPLKAKTENTTQAADTTLQDSQKDPTTLSANLKKALKGDPKPVQVEKAPAPPKVPDVVLKAIVQAEGKAATAIIEIDGKRSYTIKEGMRFTIKSSDDHNVMLVVNHVSSDGVEIEFPDLKQKISPH